MTGETSCSIDISGALAGREICPEGVVVPVILGIVSSSGLSDRSNNKLHGI
jgi:hypothetical protein